MVYNGGGYDDWMQQLVGSAGDGRDVIDVAELSGLATGDEFNEHFWYSLPTVQKLAGTVATELGTADPAHAGRVHGQRRRVRRPGRRAAGQGPGHRGRAPRRPGRGHRAGAGVPLESAGLIDATPPEFAEAVEEDTDPPAAVVAQTLALFGTDPVRALIVNAQTETPTTDQVRQAAQTGGVPIVEVTETLPAGTTDYLSWMGGQIDALATALNKG